VPNTVQILEGYWREHPAWFGRPYGEYLHLGANQELLRLLLVGVELGEESRILDLSCALGGNARWLCSIYGASVDGVDAFKPAVLAARQLAKANALGEKCRFIVGKVEELPFSGAIFDLAVTSEGDANLSEVARVLKPGGWFAGTGVAASGIEPFRKSLAEVGLETDKLVDVTDYALAFYRAKEQEAKLLVAEGLMREQDMHALQMHTVDLYEAGGAAHVMFRARRE